MNVASCWRFSISACIIPSCEEQKQTHALSLSVPGKQSMIVCEGIINSLDIYKLTAVAVKKESAFNESWDSWKEPLRARQGDVPSAAYPPW